jgi:hypothetical protein
MGGAVSKPQSPDRERLFTEKQHQSLEFVNERSILGALPSHVHQQSCQRIALSEQETIGQGNPPTSVLVRMIPQPLVIM